MCCSNSLHSSGFRLSCRPGCRDLLPFRLKSIERDQVWLEVGGSSSSQRCWVGLRSGLAADQLISSTEPFLYGAGFVPGSCWNRKETNTNCCLKVGSSLSKASLHAAALSGSRQKYNMSTYFWPQSTSRQRFEITKSCKFEELVVFSSISFSETPCGP